jgi:hypothetical protein
VEHRQREVVETAVAFEELFEEPRAGSLLGGQGGRGQLEVGGRPLTFDLGK